MTPIDDLPPAGSAPERRARVRINLAQRELEVEGSEAFVASYAERIDTLFAALETATEPTGTPPSATLTPSPETGRGALETFGELLQHLPRTATDVDRILLAGYFAQRRSADNAFATGDANALLTEQGIKVGNPSQCIRQNLVAKRVFKHLRRYRVSQTGVEYLRQLLGDRLPG